MKTINDKKSGGLISVPGYGKTVLALYLPQLNLKTHHCLQKFLMNQERAY